MAAAVAPQDGDVNVAKECVPDIIIKERTKNSRGRKVVANQYVRGKLLGKGGFAECFKGSLLPSKAPYALKIAVKKTLAKQSGATDKWHTEVSIHRTLCHVNVVHFERYFEDRTHFYMVMELCPHGSMDRLLKRRKRLTNVETRYYILQLIDAVKYLHHDLVIHRDLKLGNLFLDAHMVVKVGDFGLSTRLDHADQRKRTNCGTPNYIAPEVLTGRHEHSFEVDVWAVGVLLYHMLVGQAPFQGKDVASTYERVLTGCFTFPDPDPDSDPNPDPNLGPICDHAKDLIRQILQTNPAHRPSLQAIRGHSFFTQPSAFTPTILPESALRVAPHYTEAQKHAQMLRAQAKAARYAPSKPAVLPAPVVKQDVNNENDSGGQNLQLYQRAHPPIHANLMKPNPDQGLIPARPPAQQDAATHRCALPLHSDEPDNPPSSATLRNPAAGGRSALPPPPVESVGAGNKRPLDHGSTAGDGPSKRPASGITATIRTTATATATTTATATATVAATAGVTAVAKTSSAATAVKTTARATAKASNTRPGVVVGISTDLSPFHALAAVCVRVARHCTSIYGFGYLLSTGSVGVNFNDGTKIVLTADGTTFQYLERRSTTTSKPGTDMGTGTGTGTAGMGTVAAADAEYSVETHLVSSYPFKLLLQVYLLCQVRECLFGRETNGTWRVDGGGVVGEVRGMDITERTRQFIDMVDRAQLDTDMLDRCQPNTGACVYMPSGRSSAVLRATEARAMGCTRTCSGARSEAVLPFLHKWMRIKGADPVSGSGHSMDGILFRLSTHTVQVQFVDRREVLLCSEGRRVTYVSEEGVRSEHTLEGVLHEGRTDVVRRVKVAQDVMKELVCARGKSEE